MDVLNLAHGSFYMLGAYVGLTVLGVSGNFWLALIAAPVALGLIGALIEVVFFRRIYREGHLMQVLLTFGLTLVFVDLIRWRFGPQTHSLPTPPGLEGRSISSASPSPLTSSSSSCSLAWWPSACSLPGAARES